jgi:hypothetical protein
MTPTARSPLPSLIIVGLLQLLHPSTLCLGLTLSTSHRTSILRYARPSFELFGYVSPENDPEYKGKGGKGTASSSSTLLLDPTSTLPVPREGDIVRCSAVWGMGGKNWDDTKLGRIRFMRYNPTRECWIADVTPLQEGKSEAVFVIDRNAKTFFQDVSAIQPVQSYFLRSENGYKVALKKNSTQVILKADSYRPIDKDYVPPMVKKVDPAVLQFDLDAYSDLKNRCKVNHIHHCVMSNYFDPLE